MKILLVIPLLITLAAFMPPREAYVQLEPAEIDLGEVPADTVVDFYCVVRNVGNAPLEIRSINRSCACTEYVMPTSAVEPGDTIHIPMRFIGKGYTQGRLTKWITLVTNSPDYFTRVYYKVTIKDQ